MREGRNYRDRVNRVTEGRERVGEEEEGGNGEGRKGVEVTGENGATDHLLVYYEVMTYG